MGASDQLEGDEDFSSLASVLGGALSLVLVTRRDGTVVFANRPREGASSIREYFASPDADHLAELRDMVATNGAALRFEARGAREPGAERVYECSLSPVARGAATFFLYVATDVTHRHEAEERLRRSETMLVDVQGVAHLGTWEWDVVKAKVDWSPELYRIYAITPEVYTPTYEGYLEKVHPEDRDYVRVATERMFREHVPISHDERILLPDGSVRYLHTWAYPIVAPDGALVRLLGVCQDITDRKLAEIAVKEKASELELANARLRTEMGEREHVERELAKVHKLEALGRLAGGIAHDFNNLLAIMLGRSTLAIRALPEGDPTRDALEEIEHASRQAARMTQQLLLFSHEQVGEVEVLDLSAVVRSVTDLLARTGGASIELTTRFEEADAFVEADRSQLEQILMNLVLNARDAMKGPGKIAVDVLDGSRVEGASRPAELSETKSYVALVVADDGAGMEPSVLARVFDPYFTTKEDGHGLGLSTVYGITRQLGGAVTVTSEPGRGTTFRIFLPRASRERAPSVAPPPRADLRGAATVLVVEDQAFLRRMMGELLADLGYRVLTANGPDAALELEAKTTERIDLLLTDVTMPVMDGVALARRMMERRADLRVLFVSGWTGAALGGGTMLRDARFLQKPFTADEVARAVRDALRPR